MKSIVSFFMAILLVFGSVLPVSAGAVGDDHTQPSTEQTQVAEGNEGGETSEIPEEPGASEETGDADPGTACEQHTEATKEENRVEATCKEEGHYDEVKYCSVCNVELSRETKIIEKLEHTEEILEAVLATCTEAGKTEGKRCSVCGDILEAQQDVEALGHKPVTDAAVPATCTEPGKTEGKRCSACDDILEAQQDVEALGHKPVTDAAVPATCTEPGKTEGSHCSVCNEILTAQEVVAELEHDYQRDTDRDVAPTCTEDGVEAYTCSRCDAKEDKTLDALGHDLEHHAAQAPTCTAIGWDAYLTCKREGCGYTTYVEKAKLDHQYERDDNRDVAPTCTKTGVKAYTCSRCDATCDDTISKLPHTWNEPVFTWAEDAYTCTAKHICSVCETEESLAVEVTSEEIKEARCEVDGKRIYTAKVTVGGKDYSSTKEQILLALKHDFVKDTNELYLKSPATCTALAVRYYKCKNCLVKGDTYESGEALGHEWNEGNVSKAATCTTDGEKTFACTRPGCDGKKTEPITKLGHKWNEGTVKIPATCTADGEKILACTRENCGEQKTEVIPATGHNFSLKIELTTYLKSAATCTEPTTYYFACANCGVKGTGETTYTVGAALGHVWSTEGTVTKAATCTEDGKMTYSCTREGCNSTKVDPIAKLGHAYGEWAVETAPTCTAKGAEKRVCSNDATHVETRALEALGHAWSTEGKVTTAATCTVDGVMTYPCTREGCKETTTKPIAKLGHAWSTKGKVTKAATCTADGVMTYSCTHEGCKETTTKPIAKLGHAWSTKGKVTKAATCTADGVMTYSCTHEGCKATTTKTIKKLGHKWDSGSIIKKATCTADGTKVYTCTRKGCDSAKKETVKKLGHSWNSGKTTKSATCTVAGKKTLTCTRKGCGKTTTQAIKALGHSYTKKTVAKKYLKSAATCKASAQYFYCCSRCSAKSTKTFSYGKALGHSYTKKSTAKTYLKSAATCKASAKYFYCCSRCSAKGTKTFSYGKALGHSYTKKITTKTYLKTAANCKSAAVYCYACSRCNAKGTKTYKSGAVKHTYKTTVVKATMTKNGSISNKCTSCKKGTTTVIKKISSVELNKTDLAFNGNSQSVTVTVKDSGGKKLKLNTDYTVSGNKNKAVGEYTATVTFKGNYSGTAKRTYYIRPVSSPVVTLTAEGDGFTVTWKDALSDNADYYMVQYSNDKEFKDSTTVTYPYWIPAATGKKTITGIESGKTYYVRVLAIKEVGEKNIGATGYSRVMSVTVK